MREGSPVVHVAVDNNTHGGLSSWKSDLRRSREKANKKKIQ